MPRRPPAEWNGPVSQRPRVLIAQADTSPRAHLRSLLQRAGMDCALAPDPTRVLTLVGEKYFDVIVLVGALSSVPLVDLCLAVRRTPLNRYASFVVCGPALVLGPEAATLDMLVPRSRQVEDIMRTVQAAVAGRSLRPADEWLPPIRVHGLHIDPARFNLVVRGRPVPVTRLECALLYVLASYPGMVFSRRRLLARLWPPDTFVTVRSIDALVGRLRRKIEDDHRSPRILLTTWGEGYSVAEPSSRAGTAVVGR